MTNNKIRERIHGRQHCTRLQERALCRSARRLAGAIHRGDHRSRAPDRRSASSSLGPRRPALHDRGDGGRHRLRPQHHRHRLCRLPLDVPRARPGGVPPGRRGRVRQRRRGDGASGGYGKAAICAGIVSHVNLLLGDGAKPVLEAEIVAGNGRFRGIRHSSAWDADPNVAGMYATRPKGLLLDAPSARALPASRRSA
jgi:hypothetical protein